MKTLTGISVTVLATMFIAAGCAPVISKELRTQVIKDVSFGEIIQDPETYQGKTVIWGGIVISAKNLKEGTLIEVLQKPTDMELKPKDVDRSGGRFLALYDGYLDAAIYNQGRKVTVVGEIKGKRVLPLDEIEYTYPLISIKEIHLWPPKSKDQLYPYPYWHHRWWRYYPYWGYW